jgi:tetratricopeptide (TPR) repeat protein
MKTIKYLVMSVVLAGFSTTAMAQEAELNAALQAIKSNAANKAELVKVAQKKNKKNAEALIKLGRALYEVKDTAAANACARMANEAVKPKFSFAPAWMLLGDVEAAYGTEGGKAANYYNQSIHFDPKNPEGYKKWAMVYRKISPSQAAAKLQEMKLQCPNEDIDAITAHIYMLAGDEKKAYEAYSKADINKLDKGNLNEFVRASYFTGHFDNALKAAEAGLKLEPRNPTFNRLAMFSNYELKNYDAAKNYIHRYFNETDSAKFSEYDHFYTALIYNAVNDKVNAYKHYDKALELVNDSSMIKRWDILKGVSDNHLADGNFEKAIDYYRQYLACKKGVSMNDWAGLGTIHSKWAEALTDPAQKENALKQADEVYKNMSEKFEDAAEYATYMRANINSKLDPDSKKGLAKPYYEKLASLLSAKADKSKSDISMLTTAWHYLMAYNFLVKNDKATAKDYANKILSINPDYAPAQQIRDIK